MIASLLARLFRSGPGADLRAAQSGGKEAIARFYDAHVDGLYTFIYYRVGRDTALAEDVVQETFTIALSRGVDLPARRSDYDPARGSIATWLTVLSRNVIRDHLKAHRRSDELATAWERIDATLAQTFAAMAERPLPGEVLERAETRDLVHMAVANLPEQYRTALTRKYVDGESLETLAGELGISIDAAKSLLARARRAFRDTFATLSAHLSEVTP
jgi:RNA polymerase sigma-70 factor, ECF subfamily